LIGRQVGADFDLYQAITNLLMVVDQSVPARTRFMLMRRHHFLALILIVLAVLIAAITFKARKATGQTVDRPDVGEWCQVLAAAVA
jgi:hypothetical protein